MACIVCHQLICNTEILVCLHCRGSYHHNCVNMTSAQYRTVTKDTWSCPPCSNVTNRRKPGDSHSSPLHQSTADLERLPASAGQSNRCSSNAEAQANMSCDESLLEVSSFLDITNKQDERPPGDVIHGVISYQDFAKLLDSKLSVFKLDLNSNLSKLEENLKTDFNNNFLSILTELNEVKKDMESANDRIANLEQENVILRAELNECKSHQQSSSSGESSRALHDAIGNLKMELNEREQASLLNDIEVSGVPEFKGESGVSIILSVAAKLGVALEERDVVSAGRVGRLEPAAARPRPLVVRLARRALRDALLRSSRVRRGANTADMGLPEHEPRSFYVNERLTKTNRVLLGKARDLCQTRKWKFSWSNEGRVLVRETENSKVYQIRAECDLNRIFNMSAIPDSS